MFISRSLYQKIIYSATMLAMVLGLAMNFAPAITHAQSGGGGGRNGENCDTASDPFGVKCVKVEALGENDPRTIASNVIKIILGFLGIIAVVIILIGGFKWMTALGNDEKVEEAKKLIASGIIGLIIIVSAYAIAIFVLSRLTGISGGQNVGASFN